MDILPRNPDAPRGSSWPCLIILLAETSLRMIRHAHRHFQFFEACLHLGGCQQVVLLCHHLPLNDLHSREIPGPQAVSWQARRDLTVFEVYAFLPSQR